MMEALPPVRQKDYRWLELASMLSPALWTTQTGRGEQRTRQRSKGRPERGTVASGASTRDSARTVSAASRLVSLACRREQTVQEIKILSLNVIIRIFSTK